jgi:hypothetical protein
MVRYICLSVTEKETAVAIDDGSIAMVSSGLFAPKKQDIRPARMHRYLNYGLLGLATILRLSGHKPKVYHANFEKPKALLARIVLENGPDLSRQCLMSIPSFMSIPWAKEFAHAFKEAFPNAQLILGGRWVVDGNEAWIRQKIPEIDYIVNGFGELRIGEIVGLKLPSLSPLPHLDYSLLDMASEFVPSVEISRGCGRGCSFCCERDEKWELLRSPQDAAIGVESIQEHFGFAPLRAYFEASRFDVTEKWASEFRQELVDRSLTISWRCEMRAEGLRRGTMESLAASGLKAIDLGLESASPQQLTLMNKTPSPQRYLELAEKFLVLCNELGVWVKVNVMAYPGETASTLQDTTGWIEERRELIKGISAYPFVLYGPSSMILPEWADQGCRAVDPDGLVNAGLTHLHLSGALDDESAVAACAELSRRFMTAKDYYDLKSLSYFPREYSFQEFMNDIREIPQDYLSFGKDC